ncbi:hypothetical protein AB0942_33275 [Streptomyces nodosus]|uniref:hypothetical protein n=1 Tax=Streptomyces nodosus TaxID=40318 RepID=UPI0034534514
MTTPVAQNIPEEFQHTIDLPAPDQVDQGAVSKAKAALVAEKAKGGKARANIVATNTKIKKLQAQLKTAKTAQQKAALNAQIKAQQAYVAAQTKVQTASGKAQGDLQNKVYEASGEYDKLLSGDNRDAYMALKSLFNSYGLGSLAGKIYDYVKQGYGADTIGLLLQDTKEYKARFAANEVRAKNGLAVLNPAEYLQTEAAYRQILSAAGLPKGFYDNPADFTNWLSSDVSPTEIKSRVDMAVAATSQANSEYKNALFGMYGINEADLTAYFLDAKRATPILQKQAAAAAIGAAAMRRGFGTNALDMESYATLGITADQAEQVYGQIAQGFESMLGIAGRYGSSWSQREAEQEAFTPGAAPTLGSESAADKGKRLRSQERGLFGGGAGSSVTGLNAGYSQT